VKSKKKRKNVSPDIRDSAGQNQQSAEKEVKITSREEREKKIKLDNAWEGADSFCERLFGSSENAVARVLKPVLFAFYYMFGRKQKPERKESGFWDRREQKFRDGMLSLADSVPQQIFDRFTLAFILLAITLAAVALIVTGNLLWFIFVGLGMFCMIASTLCLKYGFKGWLLAMFFFLAMIGFFMEPTIIRRGWQGLYQLFQIW